MIYEEIYKARTRKVTDVYIYIFFKLTSLLPYWGILFVYLPRFYKCMF